MEIRYNSADIKFFTSFLKFWAHRCNGYYNGYTVNLLNLSFSQLGPINGQQIGCDNR